MSYGYGQDAYEAYVVVSEGKSLISGAPLPSWDQQAEEIREAWEAAGAAVVDAYLKDVHG